MKIRTGFVSNSSSSSFCIFGAIVPDDLDLMTLVPDDLEVDEDDVDNEVDEAVYEAAEKAGLEWESIDDTHFVGVSWKEVKDNETGAQFKKRVTKAVKKFLGVDVECETHEEAWHDG
jgi:predicted transcriptional regulator